MTIKNGLKPIKRSSIKWYPTDRSFHRQFGGVKPIEFPKNFSIDAGLTMPDQNAINLPLGCTGVASNELCTDQDNFTYDDYEDTYRKTLELEGIYELNVQGCDIRDALKIVCTVGPKAIGSDARKPRGAYYAVESSKMDWFDSIRSVILTNFQVNKIKCAVSIGTPWFPEWDSQHIDGTGITPSVFTGDPASLSWHNWAIKGWEEIDGVPYLLAKTWQGKKYGKGGWSYYSRETINSVMKIKYTGAFTVAPRDVTNVQTVRLNLAEVILRFIQTVWDLISKKPSTPDIKSPVESQKPPEPTIPPKYLWDTPAQARHSFRTICDEEGISVVDKNLLCQVLNCESGFNVKTVHPNNDSRKTIDYGICAFNNYWYAYLISPEDALNNPEKACRVFIGQFKKGKLTDWVCYKNGMYKSFPA